MKNILSLIMLVLVLVISGCSGNEEANAESGKNNDCHEGHENEEETIEQSKESERVLEEFEIGETAIGRKYNYKGHGEYELLSELTFSINSAKYLEVKTPNPYDNNFDKIVRVEVTYANNSDKDLVGVELPAPILFIYDHKGRKFRESHGEKYGIERIKQGQELTFVVEIRVEEDSEELELVVEYSKNKEERNSQLKKPLAN